MFDDPTPDPFLLGYRAYLCGETIDQCPRFDEPTLRCAWIDGWEFGRLARRIEPDWAPHDSLPPTST